MTPSAVVVAAKAPTPLACFKVSAGMVMDNSSARDLQKANS